MKLLTDTEQALARLMLDAQGQPAFVSLAADMLFRKQAELNHPRLADLGPDQLSHLLAEAIFEAAASLSDDLDPERLPRFVSIARTAWRMDAESTVAVEPSLGAPAH